MEFRDAPGHHCNWSETVCLDQHGRVGEDELDGWGATLEAVDSHHRCLEINAIIIESIDISWLLSSVELTSWQLLLVQFDVRSHSNICNTSVNSNTH